jgi:hypothetical protein
MFIVALATAKSTSIFMSTESFRTAQVRPALTTSQRALLRRALECGLENRPGKRGQRELIRELCDHFRGSPQGPEQLLIAFKGSLVDSANDAQIPHGPERTALLSRLVSVFIEELYGFRLQRPRASTNGEQRRQA